MKTGHLKNSVGISGKTLVIQKNAKIWKFGVAGISGKTLTLKCKIFGVAGISRKIRPHLQTNDNNDNDNNNHDNNHDTYDKNKNHIKSK